MSIQLLNASNELPKALLYDLQTGATIMYSLKTWFMEENKPSRAETKASKLNSGREKSFEIEKIYL